MTPKTVFGIIVRTLGLISLLYMLLFSFALGMMPRSVGLGIYYLIWLTLSIWLLSGARALVNFSYRNERE
jgi:hypothetical protein